MTNNIQRTLLGLNVYTFSAEFINEIREKNKTRTSFEKFSPEWILNKENTDILSTRDYFQFGATPSKEYILFDVIHSCPLLDLEMNEGGIEDFFKDINLKDILPTLPKISEKDYYPCIQNPVYLVIDIQYNCYKGYYDLYPECEVDFTYIGYLDSNFNIVEHECTLQRKNI